MDIQHGSSPLTPYDQEQITKTVQKSIDKQSSYLLYRYGDRSTQKTQLRQQFPIIDQIDIADFSKNKLTLKVQYHSPSIVRKLPNQKKFGSYNEYLFELNKDYVIKDQVALLHLPAYLAGLSSLKGIYHLTPEKQLINIYHTVNSHIPLKHMIVYPGAGYVAMMTTDGLKVLFSLHKTIDEQMKLYTDIYSGYDEAHRITQIDVGSLSDAIVTLKPKQH